jgi:glycerol-3-phosphate dehydrogenase subunit B
MSAHDVLVIGAGVAGLAAALGARDAGARVTVLDAHAGASALAGGAWDVASDPAASPEDVFRPSRTLAEALVARARDDAHHPYAKLGAGLVEAVRAAHARVLDALAIYRPLDLDGRGVLLATDLGLPRRAATAQLAILDFGVLQQGCISVGVFPGPRAGESAFVAASLADLAAHVGDARRFEALPVTLASAPSDTLPHPHERAAFADTDAGLARLADALERALAGRSDDAVLLPAMLGLTRDDLAATLRARLGRPVGEVVAPLAGPQGLRLARRIDTALREAGCTRRAARVRAVEPRAQGTTVVLEDGETLRGKAVILATGKHVSGGLVVRGGELVEPLAGLPVVVDGRVLPLASSSAGRDVAGLFGASPFRASPASRAGIATDDAHRALDRDGTPRAPDLYACGALLAGHDPAHDGTGLGCATTTGWLAGRSAAR